MRDLFVLTTMTVHYSGALGTVRPPHARRPQTEHFSPTIITRLNVTVDGYFVTEDCYKVYPPKPKCTPLNLASLGLGSVPPHVGKIATHE